MAAADDNDDDAYAFDDFEGAKEPQLVPYEFESSFEAGPLGLGFAVLADGTFKIERTSGQAEELGIVQDDVIVAVGGTEVTGMTKQEFVGLIQSLPRPVAVRFSRLLTAEELKVEQQKTKMWAIVKIQCIIRRRRALDRADRRRKKR